VREILSLSVIAMFHFFEKITESLPSIGRFCKNAMLDIGRAGKSFADWNVNDQRSMRPISMILNES